MLQLLFVGVIELLLDLVLIDVFLFLLSSIVVLDHHNSLPFVVPGGLRVLADYRVLGPDKEGLRQCAVNHEDEAPHCEETRVVSFLEVEQTVEFVDALLELVLQLVDIFLLFLEVLVVHVLLELKALELLMDLTLLLQLLSRLLLLKTHWSLQVLGFVLLLSLWLSNFFLSLIQVLERLLSSF